MRRRIKNNCLPIVDGSEIPYLNQVFLRVRFANSVSAFHGWMGANRYKLIDIQVVHRCGNWKPRYRPNWTTSE